MVTIKEVVTNNHKWIIKKVKQGFGGKVRIDAVRRFYDRSDSNINFFSKWSTLKYINSCRKKEGKTDLSITEY